MSLKRDDHTQTDDAVLWQGMRNGDTLVFDRLIKKHTPALFSYGWRLCQDREIVKDCIQELFFEIWNKRDVITQPSSVKWYLTVALRNRIYREQTKWRRNDPLDERLHDFALEFNIEHDLISRADDLELAKKVKQVLRSLPPRQKEIIYLRYYENMDHEQIAILMDISRQSVHNLLQKAYKSIRSEWPALIWIMIELSGIAGITTSK